MLSTRWLPPIPITKPCVDSVLGWLVAYPHIENCNDCIGDNSTALDEISSMMMQVFIAKNGKNGVKPMIAV